MPFFTLEDPNAKVKGSRDPLGVLPIWTGFARHMISNLTTAANSARGFSILLLGRYAAGRLIEEERIGPEDAMDVALRMEQIGAYVRYCAHAVEGDIRGITRVMRNVAESPGRAWINPDAKGQILSNQRTYGLWGLYSVPARESGLIPDADYGVTDGTRALIASDYLPKLKRTEERLLALIAKGGWLRLDPRDGIFAGLAQILGESYSAGEVAWYTRTLRDGAEAPTEQLGSRQQLLARLLAEITDLEATVSRQEVLALREAAARTDPGLAEVLDRILVLESLLAPVDALFAYLCTPSRYSLQQIAAGLRSQWGSGVPNLNSASLADILGEVAGLTSEAQATAMYQTGEGLRTGDYHAAVRGVLDWNREVMQRRDGAAPWVQLGSTQRLEVRFAQGGAVLPEQGELGTLWRNSYYLSSLKRVTLQLQNAA